MYFTPSPIWSVYSIHNLEDYIQKYVIKSSFHKHVHEDIVNSYETIEYLMAHSYYHWPMYDEARKKLLSLVEMAVKLRAKELNNPLTFEDRRGRVQTKKLVKLMDELKQFGYPEGFVKELHKLRKLRNIESHPDSHTYSGTLFMHVFYSIINRINELFLAPEKLIQSSEYTGNLKELNKNILEGLYIIPFKGQQVLGYDPIIVSSWKNDEKWIVSIFFHSVLNNTKVLLEEKIMDKPILLFLSAINITETEIEAFDDSSGKKISINKTIKPENLLTYNKHGEELQKVSIADRKIREIFLNREIGYYTEVQLYKSWK